jgi:PAS domain S-box-containing protein
METDRKTKAESRSAKLKADNKISSSTSKPNGKHVEKKRNQTATRPKTAKGKLPRMEKVTQQAQEELIGTRQRLLATYEHAPIGIVESSPEGNFINCNREFCHITGYSKEELITLSIKDLTYEEDYIFDIKLHQRLVAGEIPFYKLENRYLRKDGGLIWVELTRNVVRDSNGKALFTIGAAVDINERKQVEEALRRARERAEQTADRMSRLQKVTAALSETLTPPQVAEVIVEQGAPALGAVSGTIMLLTDGGQSLQIVHSASPEILTRPYQHFSISLSVPAADAVRSGQPVWIESRQQYLERYPHLADQINLWAHQAAMAIPMVDKGNILGVLTLSFDRILASTPEDREYALTLARQGAQALERARAEDALRESEARFRILVNQATAGISQTDMDGVLTIANPRLCEMLGYSESELVGKTIWELTHPEDLAENRRLFENMLNHGESFQFEKRFIRRDGSILWGNVSVSPLFDLAGSPKGGVGVIVDISERKHSEQTLMEFARRQAALYELADQLHRTNSLEDVFNAALDAILNALQCDRASILLFDDTDVMRFVAWRGLSDRYRKITEGHSPWKPDAKNPEPVYFNDIRTAELSDSLRAVIQEERIGSLAFIPLVSNGKLIGKFMIYFNAPHVFHEGELELSLTIARQFVFGVDRKRSEEKLRESEERFVLFMQHLPGLAWIKDLQGGYVYANAAAEKAFNTPREQLYGKTDLDIFPPEVATQFKNNDELALMDGKGVQVIETLEQPDGVLHFSLVSKFPIPGPDGNVAMIGGTAFDITERMQAEEALHESRERYRNLFDLVPIAVYACDADGLIQEYNHRAVELWGWEPAKNDPNEKYCGSYRIYYSDGRFMPHEKCPMARMLAGETLEQHELEILVERPDGVRRNVIAHPLPLKNERGEIVAAINCLYDITERKQAEEKIVFQANLLGAVGSAVVATDLNGTVLYWNLAAEKLYGWSASDALGKNILEIAPAPQSQERAQEIMEQLASGNSWSGEFIVQRRDGHTFPAFVSDSPILDPNGKLVGIIGVSGDITERRQAEEALRESEERFRAIVRQATAGIVRKDMDGRLLFVNQAFCDMLGYSESELVGKTIWELTHEEDIEQNKQLYDRMAAEGSPFKLEKRLIRRDGSIIWVNVSVSPIMDSAGRLQSAVAVEVDITGRKQAEQALQELNLQLENRVQSRTARLQATNQALREEISERQQAEELLRRWAHIFEHADWGIATVHQDTLTMVNPTYAKMHGHTPEELVGRSVYEVHAPQFRAKLQEQIQIAYQKGHHIYESEHIRKDGSIFPALVDTTVVRDQAGNVLYRAVNIQDITERKRVERELHESRERLQILSRRLIEVQEEERRAIARELHDRVGQTLAALNINLIIMSGQILEDSKLLIGSRLDDSLHLVAETIALVRNVMTDLRPAVLDDYGLEAALHSYIDEYRSRFGVEVFFEEPDTPLPRLDPGLEMTLLRIGQEALTNVTRHAQAKQVNVSLRLADQAVRLTVQDDGVGMDSVQGTSHPRSHGLKIMRERAQAFGGSIHIESVPGTGTKIEARIPVEIGVQDKAQEEMQ